MSYNKRNKADKNSNNNTNNADSSGNSNSSKKNSYNKKMIRQSSDRSPPRRNSRSRASSSSFPFDSIDMQIIDELLANADISSTEIASKCSVPLSTIQRRRTTLESSSMLKHEYRLDPYSFGLREVDFWIKVEKGKSEEVAQHFFEKYRNAIRVTVQMNAISNVGVQAHFDSSGQMYKMMEQMKGTRFVSGVEYAEIIRVVGQRSPDFPKMEQLSSLVLSA